MASTSTIIAKSSEQTLSASLSPQMIARRLLRLFEDTFEQYQQHNLQQQSNSTSAGHVVDQLRLLRQTVQSYLSVIVELFIETMKLGPNLVRLSSPSSSIETGSSSSTSTSVDFLCFGDLHGSLTDLLFLRHLYWKNEATMRQYHFVFLGDYVDRGIHGFEIVTYLMLLKLVYPQTFTILRGNHEVAWMNRSFFLEECRLKFGFQPGHKVWAQLNRAFSMLPYAALINEAIFCVHGGLPKGLQSLSEIDQKIPKGLVDEHFNTLALQLLWNDFRTVEYDRRQLYIDDDVEQVLSEEGEGEDDEEDSIVGQYFVPNTARHIGFIVGHKAVRHFLRKHGLSYIVRAHQYDVTVKANGYGTHSAKRVLTVFSNSAYVGQFNSTACVRVNATSSSVDIIGLRSGRRNRREAAARNHSEIFECEELAEMKFGF